MRMHNLLQMTNSSLERIIAGTPAEIEAGQTMYTSIAMLTPTKAIVCYKDFDDSEKGKAAILNLAGSTVTPVAPVVFETGSTNWISVAAVSSTKAVVVFNDAGDSNKGKACVLDISGDTITAQTAAVFLNTNGPLYTTVVVLSSTKCVVNYKHASDTKGYGCVLDITGAGLDAITPGTPAEFEADASSYVTATTLTSTKVIVCFADGGDSGKGKARILNISGATITPAGTAVVFETGGITHTSVTTLSSIKAIVSFVDSGDSNKGKACLLDCTTDSIAPATAITFNSGGTLNTDVKAINSQQAVVIFEDSGDSNKGKACLLNATPSLSAGAEVEFESGDINHRSLTAMSANMLVACYQDTTDSTKGKACALSIG